MKKGKKLIAFTVSLQLVKGLLIGVQELEYKSEKAYEKDIEIHLPFFKIIITLIYN